MFFNKDEWLQKELHSISSKLNQVSTDVASLTQDLKNIRHENTRFDKKLENIDGRVRGLENSDIADHSKWNGPKVLMAIVGPLVGAVVGILGLLTFLGMG